MKFKKLLKGFTLIELLIVLALFSVIMFGAIALMQPATTMFTNAFQSEAQSASTIGAKDYLEQTLHYAEYMSFRDTAPTANELNAFVHAHYAGKYHQDSAGNFVRSSGKVYVMRIDNTYTASRPGGQITQWSFDYAAGDQKDEGAFENGGTRYLDAAMTVTADSDDEASHVYLPGTTTEFSGAVSVESRTPDSDWCINRAYYDDNWLSFSLGVFKLDPTTHTLAWDSDFYNAYPVDAQEFSRGNFGITVARYAPLTADDIANGVTPSYTGVSIATTPLPNVQDGRTYLGYNWKYDETSSTTEPVQDPAMNNSTIKYRTRTNDNAFQVAPGVANTFNPDTIYIVYSYMDDDIIN